MQLSHAAGTLSRETADPAFTYRLTKSDVPDDTGTVTYESSDLGVAAVDEKSDEVIIVAVGTAVISATKAATEKFAEHAVRYILQIS